jgi:FlaA1/EpsC-like NDP-sugar epimerase
MIDLKSPNLTRTQRAIVLFFIYSIVLVAATFLAYGLRFDFAVPIEHQLHIQKIWFWVWLLKIVALAAAGQFSSLLSFFSIPDLKRLSLGIGGVTAGLLVLWNVNDLIHQMSRGAIILDGMASFLGLSMTRLAFRLVRQGGDVGNDGAKTVVGIVGAGELGAALAQDLRLKTDMIPVAFFDDEPRKKGTQIHGIPVVGNIMELKQENLFLIEEIIIAQPSLAASRISEILDLLRGQKIRCRTIPSLSQLASGQVVTAVRPIDIGDVLGREPVNFVVQNLDGFYAGKRLMITGAGGSIGSELSRQLGRLNPEQIVLIDKSEENLFKIHSELNSSANVTPVLLDIQSKEKSVTILEEYRPEIIFHAAAYKHVDMLERQPSVAIQNNVLATHSLAAAAKEKKVDYFVLISTDKAVEPTSIMGATKRLAEQLIEGHAMKSDSTKYMSVRFGNVLGSSGSVIPIFQRQIDKGGPVTVRGSETSRYFMSIPEAVGLVLSGASIGQNGDQFILDMGEPVRILDLAKQMIELSGKTLGEDIEIEYTDLLAGEKEHEDLHSAKECLLNTSHPKIKRVESKPLSASEWEQLQMGLLQLDPSDDPSAVSFLKENIPNFRSE